LAVSTMTLLFVSPVEGQVGEDCEVTALPGEPGSCPPTDDLGNPLYCYVLNCDECAPSLSTLEDCQTDFAEFPPFFRPDQVANC